MLSAQRVLSNNRRRISFSSSPFVRGWFQVGNPLTLNRYSVLTLRIHSEVLIGRIAQALVRSSCRERPLHSEQKSE